MTDIVTLTLNPAVDKSTEVDRVAPDQKLRCDPPRHEPGGGGINVARVVHRLGGKCRALYPYGGPPGQMLQQLLDKEGVDHFGRPIQGWTRENLMVYERSGGQQYRFGMPGPELGKEEWRWFLDDIESIAPTPRYLVASGSLPPGAPVDFYGQAARIARKRNIRFVVDTSGESLRKTVEEGVYLIKPNMREFGGLVGREVQGESEMTEAARALMENGKTEILLLSLGSAGAHLYWKEGHEIIRAPTAPIRSKVGAGDSTVGALVLALARGEEIGNAARFGMAAGAAAVMTPGSELCRREDVERLYREMQ